MNALKHATAPLLALSLAVSGCTQASPDLTPYPVMPTIAQPDTGHRTEALGLMQKFVAQTLTEIQSEEETGKISATRDYIATKGIFLDCSGDGEPDFFGNLTPKEKFAFACIGANSSDEVRLYIGESSRDNASWTGKLSGFVVGILLDKDSELTASKNILNTATIKNALDMDTHVIQYESSEGVLRAKTDVDGIASGDQFHLDVTNPTKTIGEVGHPDIHVPDTRDEADKLPEISDLDFGLLRSVALQIPIKLPK